MRPRLLLPVVILAAGLAAACGGSVPSEVGTPAGSAPGTTAAGSAVPHTTDPTAVIVDVSRPLGGFVTPQAAVDHRPLFRLYGDGTAIATPAESDAAFGAFPRLVTYRLTPEAVDWVLQRAAHAGLIGASPDYGRPGVTDVGTTTVVVDVDAGRFSHQVYALGFQDPAAGLTAAQVAARKQLSSFVEAVTALPSAHPELLAADPAPYRAQAAEVYAFELQGEAPAKPKPWPLAEPLAQYRDTDGVGGRCQTIRGADVAALEQAAGQDLGTAVWRSGAGPGDSPLLWTVGVNLLLPGDSGCEASSAG
jgi:hypothetical protein